MSLNNKKVLIENWEGHGDINDRIIVDIHKPNIISIIYLIYSL